MNLLKRIYQSKVLHKRSLTLDDEVTTCVFTIVYDFLYLLATMEN